MHGPMRPLSAPGLPLLLLVLLASPFAIASSLRKLADTLNDDKETYALLMLDPAGGAETLPSIALPRRITAKSVFIAPSARPKQPPCEEGYQRDGSGACVRHVKVDTKNTWNTFLDDLNKKFGLTDPLPETAAEAQAAAEAVQAVAVATQVAAEASPPALEPLHFHIPIDTVPEVTTTEANTESTTIPTTTDEAGFTQAVTFSPETVSYEPEVILVDSEKSPSLSLSIAPVVVVEPEASTEATTTTSTASPPTTRPPTRPPPSTPSSTAYAVKSDSDVDADPIINSVSDSPLLAGLKRLSPIVVAELPEWPSPSPSAAAAAQPLDASAVPPRRRPSSSFVRFPGTAPPSSKPVVFPSDDSDDPPRRVFFPQTSGHAGRRFGLGRTH